MEKRINNLIEYVQGVYQNKNGKELYEKYLEDIQQVTPMDVFVIQNENLKLGIKPKEMVGFVDKLVNVFYKSLNQFEWNKPEAGTFLYYLMEENKGFRQELVDFKVIIKEQEYERNRESIEATLVKFQNYNHHLVKLENILFPYLEKKEERFDGLKIMWSLHDDIRKALQTIIAGVKNNQFDLISFNIEIGKLIFALYGVIEKQEILLFPAAAEVLDENDFSAMHKQSFDYPFVFIDSANIPVQEQGQKVELFENASNGIEEIKKNEKNDTNKDEDIIRMKTGSLSLEQVELMINTLPVDITFVDENDKVAFFSNPKERAFPRSVAIIGRDVRNCHPPESVHMVESIISDFKNNLKNQENFWIQIKGLFLLIQYFAVRNAEGKYLGTLEVSQEISHIQKLEGEKRLLD